MSHTIFSATHTRGGGAAPRLGPGPLSPSPVPHVDVIVKLHTREIFYEEVPARTQIHQSVNGLKLGQLLLAKGVKRRGPLHLPTLDHPNLVCDARDKILVVRHQHHASLEGGDAVRQRGDRFEVEVVCRLVEDEDVRRCVRDGGEGDTRALPSAQRRGGHGLLLLEHTARGEVRAERLLVGEVGSREEDAGDYRAGASAAPARARTSRRPGSGPSGTGAA